MIEALKKCSKCGTEKSLANFSDRKTAKGTIYKHARCNECLSQYKRSWENKDRKEVREYIFNYLSNNSCVLCGTTDVLALEFDHIEPTEKEFNMCYAGNGKQGGKVSLDILAKEIAKCQVLCRNCHQKETHKHNNSWRYQMLMAKEGSNLL